VEGNAKITGVGKVSQIFLDLGPSVHARCLPAGGGENARRMMLASISRHRSGQGLLRMRI
jgi:hypothetical protein